METIFILRQSPLRSQLPGSFFAQNSYAVSAKIFSQRTQGPRKEARHLYLRLRPKFQPIQNLIHAFEIALQVQKTLVNCAY